MYENLRPVLNSVFKYAINSGLITHNPVALIPFKRAERKNRRALTKEEQLLFAERIFLPEFKTYKQAFLIMFYFGLRPCELKNARFEDTFLIAQNAKRKGGKIEYKKIPVPKQAQEKLDITQAVSAPVSMNKLNDAFKRILQDDTVTQYYLRHTFATTCQQFVRPDIVDIWMGDSRNGSLEEYTHISLTSLCKRKWTLYTLKYKVKTIIFVPQNVPQTVDKTIKCMYNYANITV